MSNGNGETHLHLAVCHRNTEFAATLIAAEADVDVGNGNGETPLQSAVSYRNTHVATILNNLLATHRQQFDFDL